MSEPGSPGGDPSEHPPSYQSESPPPHGSFWHPAREWLEEDDIEDDVEDMDYDPEEDEIDELEDEDIDEDPEEQVHFGNSSLGSLVMGCC